MENEYSEGLELNTTLLQRICCGSMAIMKDRLLSVIEYNITTIEDNLQNNWT